MPSHHCRNSGETLCSGLSSHFHCTNSSTKMWSQGGGVLLLLVLLLLLLLLLPLLLIVLNCMWEMSSYKPEGKMEAHSKWSLRAGSFKIVLNAQFGYYTDFKCDCSVIYDVWLNRRNSTVFFCSNSKRSHWVVMLHYAGLAWW